MADVRISVIIPVYNAEKYLNQCLDSVINQSMQEIEIICINDGSSDGSLDILRSYEAEDVRIHVISQTNCGAGNARNNGIKIATGEYLAFLDSDDWYDLTALEKLYSQVVRDDADVCVCGRTDHLDCFDKRIDYKVLPDKKYYPQSLPFRIGDDLNRSLNFTNGTVWNKLFKRSFIDKNKIFFPEVKRGQDIYFTTLALCLAERITVLNEALIHYRVFRSDSLTATINQNPEVYLEVWLRTTDELIKRNRYPQRSMANRAWGSILLIIRQIQYTEYDRFYNRIKTDILPKLGIQLQEPGYFYIPWQEELLKHFLRENAEEFLMSYLYVMEIRIRDSRESRQTQIKKYNERIERQQRELERQQRELEKQQNKLETQKEKSEALKKQIKEMKLSASYRIGHAITFIPRKVKSLFQH